MSIDFQFQNQLMGRGLEASALQGLLDASYGGPPPSGWSKDKNLSTNQTKVFVGPGGQAVVAHRGTVGTAQDWANNAVYGLSGTAGYKQTGRFQKAQRTQKEAEDKYGKVITIGHSQGGLLAETLGKDEIITLNKAARPGDFLKTKKKKQTDVRSSRDIVSSLGRRGRRDRTIAAENFNPISEHGTDILERLDEGENIGLD